MKLTQPDPEVAIAVSILNLANMCFQFLRRYLWNYAPGCRMVGGKWEVKGWDRWINSTRNVERLDNLVSSSTGLIQKHAEWWFQVRQRAEHLLNVCYPIQVVGGALLSFLECTDLETNSESGKIARAPIRTQQLESALFMHLTK